MLYPSSQRALHSLGILNPLRAFFARDARLKRMARNVLRGAALSAVAMAFVSGSHTLAAGDDCETQSLSADALMQWPAWGTGQRMSVSRQLLMEESEGSLGYMLVSPAQVEGPFTLTFETLILTPTTVMVVGLIGSSASGDPLSFPEGYNAELRGIFNTRPFMMAPFHNASHNRAGAFLATFEGGERQILDEADRIFTRVDTKHEIEFGKDDEHVWLKIDGENVVSGSINPGTVNAYLVLRIRGTGFREAATIIRNVEITQCAQ